MITENKQKKTENHPLILIADDMPKNIQVLGNILKKIEYRIAVANCGEQVINFIENMVPDLILLDIMMPGMDGFEVSQIIRKMEKGKDVPIIFLTAKTESESIVKGFQLGAVDYITKPFKREELLVRVNTHLEIKRIRSEQAALILQLEEALSTIKNLSGLIPICAQCKNVRDDKGYWQQVESFIKEHSNADFSHSICPECAKKLYPWMQTGEE